MELDEETRRNQQILILINEKFYFHKDGSVTRRLPLRINALCSKCINEIESIKDGQGCVLNICENCTIDAVADYFIIKRRKQSIFPDERDLMETQLELINQLLPVLEQLLETTFVDSPRGRGSGSFYPDRAINHLKTMKFAIELELQGTIPVDLRIY